MPVVLIIAAAATLGSLALRPLRLFPGIESWTSRLLAGLCLCAGLVMVLGSLPHGLDIAQTVLSVIALIGLVWGWRRYRNRPENSARRPAGPAEAPYTPFDYACLAATTAALVLALISELAPVTSWDATVAHIALPAAYARSGRIHLESGNVYSAYPHLMHCLYAAAYYRGGEKPVTLLNWAVALLACGAVYSLGRRVENRRTGLIAAALLSTAPIFMDQAGGVSIDLAFAALSIGGLAALLSWPDERNSETSNTSSARSSWLILSGFLAGSACGVRHTGYLVCALLCLGILVFGRAGRLKAALTFGAAAGLAASPWLIRSALLVGNPVFPFLLSRFPTHGIDHLAITGLGIHESIAKTGGMDFLTFLRFPWDIVMRPGWYDGWSKSPGAMVLLLGVPGLLAGGRRARALGAYSIAGGACFFFFQRLARYILPFFIPMMVVAGVAAERLLPFRKAIQVLLVVAFVYGLALHTAAVYFKVPVVLGLETRDEYLARRVERYPAFQFANRRLNNGSVILTVDQRSYYIDAPSYQNHWGLKAIRDWPPARQRAWLRDRGIKYVILPVTFVKESGALADLQPMLNGWRTDPAHFRLIETLNLPSIRGIGLDRVEIYEVVYESDTSGPPSG